jgi:hypothetical protein
MKLRMLAVAGLTISLLKAADPAPDAPLVPYPEGFREWTHLGSVTTEATEKTKERLPHGIIRHLYANEKAMEGLRTGIYPEGAMFVADWFPLKVKYAGNLHEDARDRTDVMVKDARFAATGGWGYDQFKGDSKEIRAINGAAPNSCFECHTKVRARDYVFSKLRP